MLVLLLLLLRSSRANRDGDKKNSHCCPGVCSPGGFVNCYYVSDLALYVGLFPPGLVNSCIIDWFSPWPEQALYAVASTFIAADVSIGFPVSNVGLLCFFQSHDTNYFYLLWMFSFMVSKVFVLCREP